MATATFADFLELARSHRLLPPDQLDNLSRLPDLPHGGLPELLDLLRSRGVLTAFQSDLIRSGRTDDLTFAGYAVLEDVGPCPGGTAYRAMHPALRRPVELRRLRPCWFAPADTAATFALRAQTAAAFTHPNLAQLLDAGAQGDEAFLALEPFDGADLETLIRDIGPMPSALAASYGRQVAAALAAAHNRGLVHGHVRPSAVRVGPLVTTAKPKKDGSPRRRPSSSATVLLYEVGATPNRPPMASLDPSAPAADFGYLPPERLDSPEFTASGDVYGLGAALYFLLTGRVPIPGQTVGELVHHLRDDVPPLVQLVRPDVPGPLARAIRDMMLPDPSARPTAAAIAELLTPMAPTPKPAAPAEDSVPIAAAADSFDADIDLTDIPPPESRIEWKSGPVYPLPGVYIPPDAAQTWPAQVNAELANRQEPPSNKLLVWVIAGLLLQAAAVGLWYVYFTR